MRCSSREVRLTVSPGNDEEVQERLPSVVLFGREVGTHEGRFAVHDDMTMGRRVHNVVSFLLRLAIVL